MSMFLPVAKIDLTSTGTTLRVVTSATASTPVQLPAWTGGSATPNPWNTTAGKAGGPRDLAARGIWLISVQGSVCNILAAQTSTAATNGAPYFPIGMTPLPVEIPPGTWISVLGTATAGTVDFIRVDAFRD
jgi:hypothetical protein